MNCLITRSFEKRIIVFILLFSSIGSVLSQGPPVFTDSPVMLGLQGKAVRTFALFSNSETHNNYSQILAVPYNILTNTQAGFSVPFTHISRPDENDDAGLGNLRLFLKQLIFQKDAVGATFRSALKWTQTIPISDKHAANGLGLNSTASDLSLVNGYVRLNYSIFATLGYQWTGGSGADIFHYEMAFGKPLLPQKYPPIQINLYAGINSQLNSDSGDHLVLISPAVQYIISRFVLLEAGIQIPVHEPQSQEISITYLLGGRFLIF